MLDTVFLPVIEGLSGKKLATHIGEMDSSGATERTVRNWNRGKGQPSPETLEAIAISGRRQLRAKLLKLNWPEAEVSTYLQDASSMRGLLSGFVHSMSAPNRNIYAQTLTLALQIEETSDALREFRSANQIRPFADLLLSSSLIEAEHFTLPGLGVAPAAEVQQQVVDAVVWEDLDKPVKVITVNLVMQLMATLDLEFCAGYLGAFAATPVFDSLMPRVDPDAKPNGSGAYPALRNLFQIPVRRLIELSACLRHYKLHGKWPAVVPSVLEMEKRMDTDAATLTKWRMGRRFTLADFQSIWAAMHRDLPESDQPNTPTPLVFAAILLTHLYVKGSREKKPLSMFIPDPKIYTRWWHIQKQRSALKELNFGSESWMPALA